MLESHGNHSNSTSRALKTACDLIGAEAVLDGEERLLCAVHVCKPDPARAEAICAAVRTGYSTPKCRIASGVWSIKTEVGPIHTDQTF